MRLVFVGLSITSSWGNGHATTYRGLVRELGARGHDVLFLERDVPYYAAHRDAPRPVGGRTGLYRDLDDLRSRFNTALAAADLVVVGSYVPEGIAVGRWVTDLRAGRGPTIFYDIDTPITLEALEAGACAYLDRELVPAYDLYLSFTAGPTLRRLEREFGSPRARPLLCSMDPTAYAPDPDEATAAPAIADRAFRLGYMGTYSDDRQPGLEALLVEPARRRPTDRFIVAGPQYPAGILWPGNVARVEHLPPGEHHAFYNRQDYTLNLTRAAMRRAGWSPSVRLFEAAACGVPIITDRWPGLEEFFTPGEEVLVADTPDDVLGFLELPAPARRAVGARARRRVLAAHTAAHRAAELEGYAREAGAG